MKGECEPEFKALDLGGRSPATSEHSAAEVPVETESTPAEWAEAELSSSEEAATQDRVLNNEEWDFELLAITPDASIAAHL